MDILFFAILAIYIFYKLREQLGKVSDDEKIAFEEKMKAQKAKLVEEVIKSQESTMLLSDEQQIEKNNQILSNLNDELRQKINQILLSCKISADFFINGAKSAFEMIIKAFSEDNLSNVKFLLSQEVYDGFANSLSKTKSAQKKLNTNIIAIDNPQIIAASLNQNQATITVRINSKQINYFTDSEGKIIEGRKDEIADLVDVWTFSKDIDSSNPNWILSRIG